MFSHGSIQIAGIRNVQEAKLLEDLHVQYLGFPLVLDFHDEDCTVDEARKIISELKKATVPVLITYLTQPMDILALCSFLHLKVVQLHAPTHIQTLLELKRLDPELVLIKSLIVGQDQSALFAQAKESTTHVDAFLTDTYDSRTGATGATGQTHDWQISRDLVKSFQTPLILAGGLNPENVADAIRAVQPMGVDCHTGVEGNDGYKDPDRVLKFIHEAETAFKLKEKIILPE